MDEKDKIMGNVYAMFQIIEAATGRYYFLNRCSQKIRKITEKQLFWSLFLITLQAFKPLTL